MQAKSIAECSEVSILHYFRPSLSYRLSLRSLFCLLLSDCFTQILLYWNTRLNAPFDVCLYTPVGLAYPAIRLISRTTTFYCVLGVFFFLNISNFNRTFCKQNVKILIRHCIMQCLMWICTVCICPTKRWLSLYGLKYQGGQITRFFLY